MAVSNGTVVTCVKCGNEWTTRAKKKAVCTNRKCKSQQVNIKATGVRYHARGQFIDTLEDQQARQILEEGAENLKESMKIEVDKKPIAEKEIKGDDLLSSLFGKDGKTPKITPELKAVFAGLPKPSPILTANIQQLSMLPARYLGMHWLMSKEEAEMIASATVAVAKDAGLKLIDLPPATLLAVAFGLYAGTRAIPHVIGYLFPDKKPSDPDFTVPEPVGAPSTHYPEEEFAAVPEQDLPVEELKPDKFARSYGDSLDEHGRDKYASDRGFSKYPSRRKTQK